MSRYPYLILKYPSPHMYNSPISYLQTPYVLYFSVNVSCAPIIYKYNLISIINNLM